MSNYIKYKDRLYRKVKGAITASQSDIDSRIDIDAEIERLKKELEEAKKIAEQRTATPGEYEKYLHEG